MRLLPQGVRSENTIREKIKRTPRRALCGQYGSSEVDLGPDLNVARIVPSVDGAEAGPIIDTRVDCHGVAVVERIESFETQLQA